MSSEQLFCNPVIVDAVFSFLSLKDIKNAALVSRSWRQMGEVPKYWRKAEMIIYDFDEKMATRMKTVRRVKYIAGSNRLSQEHFFNYLAKNKDIVLDQLRIVSGKATNSNIVKPLMTSPPILLGTIVNLEAM